MKFVGLFDIIPDFNNMNSHSGSLPQLRLVDSFRFVSHELIPIASRREE